MTSGDDRDDRSKEEGRLSPEEISALRALEALPRLKAGVEARERTRALFVEVTPPGPDLRVGGERRGLSAILRPIAIAAAVALLVAGVVHVGMQPSSQWFVTDLVEAAGITAVARPSETGDVVLSGRLGTGPESELEIQLGEQLRFRMLALTTIELPPPPGRWFAKARTIQLTEGEIYGTTSGGRSTFPLSIETPEATARLLGTTFAAFRTEEGTCFCLWSGGIEVTPADGSPPTLVPTEHKFYVYKDGRTPELLPIDDMERMKLSMTHDAGLAPKPTQDQ